MTRRHVRSATERLPLSSIVASPRFQPRESLDRGRVRRLVDELRGGGFIREPILVTPDSATGTLTLVDGWHRYTAALEASLATLEARVEPNEARAREMAAEANLHGREWSRKDAMRHVVLRIKAGDFRNADLAGTPAPLSVIANQYAGYGVKRMALTRYLDATAVLDDAVAEFLRACRTANDKCNRAEAAPLSPAELATMKRQRRQYAATAHLKRAAELFAGAPRGEREQLAASFRQLLLSTRADF